MQHLMSLPCQWLLRQLAIVISHHILSFKLHLYKKAWEYASIGELIIIFQVVTGSIVVAAFFNRLSHMRFFSGC